MRDLIAFYTWVLSIAFIALIAFDAGRYYDLKKEFLRPIAPLAVKINSNTIEITGNWINTKQEIWDEDLYIYPTSITCELKKKKCTEMRSRMSMYLLDPDKSSAPSLDEFKIEKKTSKKIILKSHKNYSESKSFLKQTIHIDLINRKAGLYTHSERENEKLKRIEKYDSEYELRDDEVVKGLIRQRFWNVSWTGFFFGRMLGQRD